MCRFNVWQIYAPLQISMTTLASTLLLRSVTLKFYEILSQNLVQIYKDYDSPYVFYGIMPLCKFQYTNGIRSITLKPCEIISWNEVQI